MLSPRSIAIFLLTFIGVCIAVSPCVASNQDHVESHRRILRSASELDYPPFALVREDGSADGFSVDLLRAVAKAAGLDVTFKVGPWNHIKGELIDGRLDVLPLVSYSRERDAVLDFTVPYLRMHGAIFVRKDEQSIHREADLKGKEVLVMRGDTAHEYAVRKKLTDKLILTDSFEDAMRQLAAGKHDAVIVQQLVGIQLINKLNITNVVSVHGVQESNLKPVAEPLSGFAQKFCFAVKEGDKKLLARLNEGLSIVVANGVYNDLYDKWFSPILPKPPVSAATLAKYFALVVLPMLIMIGIGGIFYLKKEIARKTKHLREQINVSEAAEESLRQTRDTLRAILDAAPAGVIVVHREGRFLLSSKLAQHIFDSPIDGDVEGADHGYRVSNPDGSPIARGGLPWSLALGGQTVFDTEMRITRSDGTQSIILASATPLKDQARGIWGAVTVFQDITERKQVEQALRQLSQFPEENPNPVMRIAGNGALLYSNAAARQLLATLDWQAQEALPPAVSRSVEEARGQNRAIEAEIATPEGHTFGFFAIQPHGEDYINLYGMDLTGRKEAEDALKASEKYLRDSLNEKEVLLKEIHHRVKNNMQVISSLVDLQAEEVKDDAMRSIFQDVIHRVRSMAMVHEKLYQSANLAQVEFADYTQSLVDYLWHAYGASASGVSLDLDLAPVLLPLNKAVPCGLILNELFCNTLKHAFNGCDGGKVTILLRGDARGQVHLCVRDNGIGLPADINWRQADSLGLRLVQMLTRQLHAALNVSRNNGTEFAITFEERST